MSYMGGKLATKKLVKHKVGAQVKKNQKACTTSTMSEGGGKRAKKKQRPRGLLE
jgi:hypothetical protein